MSNPRDVVVLVGSLRKESYNRKLAKALIAQAPAQLKLEILEIGELQLYNQDLDDKPPQTWAAFRDRVRRADAVLFVTPEYNRSVPAPLKNAIDVGSRPYGSSVWDGKPAAIVSASPGAVGGFGANHHLRQSMVFLNVPLLQQPEAYIGGVDKLLDEQGGIASESTRGFLDKFLAAFAMWIDKTAATR
ncbi:NADPH-dependent FMN reductase [Cupriavidus sp. AcVe19-6a]|uniref:NADPH-dependent FMN reductase n=1 Tax=Cupriavidus sp. AcVe19-6a TaxID=2821358 RepID=UPI001AE70EED|nr:NAD(P)H-dependent oxidoreductase [Cupriavidus sp. AcVe19-6a]MBP0635363.1 NAD(P)H-dependent oxidoreductase [Cupriavidus sp. AcVe19-6a]